MAASPIAQLRVSAAPTPTPPLASDTCLDSSAVSIIARAQVATSIHSPVHNTQPSWVTRNV